MCGALNYVRFGPNSGHWPMPVPPRRGTRRGGLLMEKGYVGKSGTLMIRATWCCAISAANGNLANVGFAAVQKPTFYRKRAQVAEDFARHCRDEIAKQMFQRVAGRWRELATLAGSRKPRRTSARPKRKSR